MSSGSRSGRLHVLVLAYSISPVRGSEYSVGWNHVREMAKECDLTVLYGLAGDHMGDLEEIEDWIEQTGGMENVTFEAVRPNGLAKLLNTPNRMAVLTYSFYLAYRVWHAQAFRRAEQIVSEREVDLVHYLCPIGYREPGYLWKIGKPYIWGPVGGMVPTRHLPGTPRSWRAIGKVRAKNLLNSIQLAASARVAKAMDAADLVVAATSENRAIMASRYKFEAKYLAENAIPDEWLDGSDDYEIREGEPISLVWIGSLDIRKSPDLLVDALSRVQSANWHLHLIGDGPLAPAAKALATEKGIADRITFHGLIPRKAVSELLARAGLHLITSMAEGNPTVIWEAMASGVPTVTLDHSGMSDVVCNKCGVRVPISSYEETCSAIAEAIDQLLNDRARLRTLHRGVLSCRERYRWSRRVDTWLDLYATAIDRHQNR